jgi:dipeptidyl aminopeptidase/acylaminoacyl peptidase
MKSWFLPALAGMWLSLAPCAHASMREVKPGEVPALGPDEGLLVVDVNTSRVLDALHIRRDNKVFGGDDVRDVPRGRTSRLYVATAGDYRWDSIDLFLNDRPLVSFDLERDEELHFQVKPGVINYPGDFVDRSHGFTEAIIHSANHGLVAIDWLRAHHPGVYQRYAFFYTGHYVDPFPEFYRTERATAASRADADLARTLPAPAPGALPIPLKDLWPDRWIQRMELSPGGDLLAEVTVDSKASHLDVIDLKTRVATRVMNAEARVDRIDWIDDATMALSYNVSQAPPGVCIIHVGGARADGRRTATKYLIPRTGWVVGTLPNDSDHLLYQTSGRNNALHVFRIDVSGPDAGTKFQFSVSDRLDHGIEGATDWFTDGTGKLRAAVVKQGADWMIYYGTDGRYRPVLEASDFSLLALSDDGRLLYGLSDRQRGQTDLVSFDPVSRTFATVYSKPGVDIQAPVFDTRRHIIGASYYQHGLRVVDYFAEADRAVAARIAKAFPDATTLLIDRDDAGKQFVVLVQASDQPPRYYHYDAEHSTAILIDESAPGLAQRKLATTRTFEVTAGDGAKIEAQLTLPPGATGKVPLVVYPHGGPIGVRDSLEFDPSVQLFASLGYAVLQVNFHGSEGFGRAFREAGKRHFGSLIEDDIDAATRKVLGEQPIDPARVCIVGSSYGGFSAMVSAIRWPQRFRCAVSISGVSDQQLLFTASDSSRTAQDREEGKKIIGDPVADGATMRMHSPLYRYRELAVPVMLAHGTEDQRVDYENSFRLARMLNIAGRAPVMMTLEGEGHGGFENVNEIALWGGVAGFLRAHLDARPAAQASR